MFSWPLTWWKITLVMAIMSLILIVVASRIEHHEWLLWLATALWLPMGLATRPAWGRPKPRPCTRIVGGRAWMQKSGMQ